jgi:sec-independent protein translocase protein TatC
MAWFPSLADLPMSLGDHLHELRRRLVWPILTVGVVFCVAFCFVNSLRHGMLHPLRRAAVIAGEANVIKLGMVHGHDEYVRFVDGEFDRVLNNFSITESTNTGIKLSGAVGLAAALPVLLWHLWKFVSVGLTARERGLAFFFCPLGVVLFYFGLVVGFFWGVPFFFAWLIDFTALDPTVSTVLRQSEFVDDLIFWLLSMGLVMDIPWLVMVLVRLGVVTTVQLSKFRRYVVGINVVVACCVCPATDAISVFLTFLPIQLLFEIGLFIGRFIEPKKAPPPDQAAPA